MQLSQLTQPIFNHLYRDIFEFRSTFDLPVNDSASLDDKADTLHTSNKPMRLLTLFTC
jgi:hypothetical protein